MHEPKKENILIQLEESSSTTDVATTAQAINDKTLSLLSREAEVTIVPSHASETAWAQLIQAKKPKLIFLPWRDYLQQPNLLRSLRIPKNFDQDPIELGYFSSPTKAISSSKSPFPTTPPESTRCHLFHFAYLKPSETTVLLRSLLTPTSRAHLSGLLPPGTPVYFMNWCNGFGLGDWLERFLCLPEIVDSHWISKQTVLRILFISLWSLIFEEGPGKIEYQRHRFSSHPKAYFQVGISERCLAFRLIYESKANSVKSLLEHFWPKPFPAQTASQMLSQFADLVRIHAIGQSSNIELVIALYSEHCTQLNFMTPNMLWVDTFPEVYYSETESKTRFGLDMIPFPNSPTLQAQAEPHPSSQQALKGQIQSLESQIREMRIGGVGVPYHPANPGPDQLLDAFSRRFLTTTHQLSELKNKKHQGTPSEQEFAEAQIQSLIQSLEDTLAQWSQKIRELVGTHGKNQ